MIELLQVEIVYWHHLISNEGWRRRPLPLPLNPPALQLSNFRRGGVTPPLLANFQVPTLTMQKPATYRNRG